MLANLATVTKFLDANSSRPGAWAYPDSKPAAERREDRAAAQRQSRTLARWLRADPPTEYQRAWLHSCSAQLF